MSNRRLPVYFLLDCSESMAGPAIDMVNQGVQSLVREMKNDPRALETVALSVITFSRYAKQVVPLTDIIQFQMPRLTVRPGTALGAALSLMRACIDREVVRTTPTTKGDYRPLVFLLTDGAPTDDWESAADLAYGRKGTKVAHIYAIGCGTDVDTESLKRVTDVVFNIKDLTPDVAKKFFVWLTASVKGASARVEGTSADKGPIDPREFPQEIMEAPRDRRSKRKSGPRQVFLYLRCQKSKRPYLMRYTRGGEELALDNGGDFYVATASHILEESEGRDGGEGLSAINSSQLQGVAPCPHCGNRVAAKCPDCQGLFCDFPENNGLTICPHCKAQLGPGGSNASFDIKPSEG
jgi:uncharacterized protein YegL